MKIYIRSDDLNANKPIVLAAYPDSAVIPDGAHGDGVTVLTVPDEVIMQPDAAKGIAMPHLASDWRQKAGAVPAKAEAKRRIEKSFSISDQLNMLHDIVDAITKYGADMSKWPADVRQRKMVHDEGRKYIADVREKAKMHGTVMPRDPASDKIWPTRMTKK